MQNPLLQLDALPAFDRIEASHARPALEHLLADNRARLAELTAQPDPTFDSLVVPAEELSYRLSRVWSPIGHLNAVANSAEMREAYNECVPLLTAYSSELGQNEALYAGYAHVLRIEGERLDPAQRKLVENSLRDFRLAGVDLPPQRQARYREVVQRLAQLATKFSENVLDAARAYTRRVTDESELAGLPANAIDRAAANAREANQSGWLFKLDQPTYMTVMTSAQSSTLRRDIYEAWVTRASELGPSAGRFDNNPLIAQILPLRHELAHILGYPNFADYALATRMAKSSKQVLGFLEDLARRCRPAARREFQELEEFAGRKLEAWDLAYFSERLQESRFKVSQEALRPYFPLPKVLSGLFAVTERLYGITARERPAVAVWHPSVRYYDLVDGGGRIVAGFYLDPYSRLEKRSGAWMDECVVARSLPTGSSLPVAQLVCNFTAPVGNTPSLLTHDEVTTLFHEFGHGLHHMLTRVPYPSIAGINGVAWDAVELPSQFMENFVWRVEVLPLISAHVSSGEPLPADMLKRLLGTRTFNAALDTLRQIELASFDFELHANFDPGAGARVAQTLSRVRERVAVAPTAAFNRMPASFSHIFAGGYAAGYYSYKWAEVLAADAFEAFEQAGVFDAATAARFLDSILARGGSLDAMDAFVRFRGRPPDVRPLLKQTGIAA
ncbi:MAG TPA: M3 family metallopeptidase [Steroidobacteraceae bacterium]|nr:M3 family metallopeptidase [Steroidobacteraceae bacterium]HUO19939.1 M3 family metallopeptidase [Steroidobacteraceae bacterium]